MTMLHQPKEIIAERYQIITTLGEGGMACTYAAYDLANSQPVALKAISLRQANEWKILELFEREAKVLASIDHPFIPDYLDYFELDTNEDRRFYLVQELVAGKSLAELVAHGWEPNEVEVKDIAMQLLNILTYLHSRTPTIIHRDIKPQNIIRRQDRQIYLVDFGAVQDVYCNNSHLDRTLVGTLGYISWEQIQGNVIPASDLYSLGCCLLFLLTRKSPAELPRTEMKFDFSSQVKISPSFAAWLRKIVEPMAENRFDSAISALQALENKSEDLTLKPTLDKPEDSKIIVDQQSDCLRYTIPLGFYHSSPSKGLFSRMGKLILAIGGLFIIPEITVVGICVWLFYLGSFPHRSKSKQLPQYPANIAQKYLALEINSQTFCLERTVGISESGIVNIDKQEGKTTDIRWVDNLSGKKGLSSKKDGSNCLIIATRQGNQERQYAFGNDYLNQEEAKMIASQIKEFIHQKF